MDKDTGGPAYPVDIDFCETSGMTWLDAAAIKIAAASVANPMTHCDANGRASLARDVAGAAYDFATALLAEKRRREAAS